MKSDVLSTRQVAQLLGVGEATVKRWADAGQIDCFRSTGGHRKFRLRDVTGFVQSRHYEVAGTLPVSLPAGADDLGPGAARQFEKLALKGNASACVAQLAALRLRGATLAEIFDGAVLPALSRIGAQWRSGHLTLAEERAAAQTVVEALARAQPLAEPAGEPNRADRGTAVVAPAAGEVHDIGARMAACLLRAFGFEVLAPLAQMPAWDLAELIVRSRAALVVLTSTAPPNGAPVAEQVRMAATAVRQTGGRVLIAGSGMAAIGPAAGVVFLRSMRELSRETETAGRRARPRLASKVEG